MKNDVMPSIVQMEAAVLKKLVEEVKETVATGIILPKTAQKKFGAADLWNVRRNSRTAMQRLRY
jgi:hypothetical protein